MEVNLYRAADSDTWSDTASFAESLAVAREYLNNPGYGGSRLWKTTIETDDYNVLDLSEMDTGDALEELARIIGTEHPGAIGPDEWTSRISYDLRDAGIDWVRVRESFPFETVSWIFVGSDDPELVEVRR